MRLTNLIQRNNPRLHKALHLAKERYFYGIRNYIPKEFKSADNLPVRSPSAWKGLELIIGDVIKQSGIHCNSCLEFGVEYGYSTATFANHFKSVTGVDIFTGDIHSGFKENIYETAMDNLKAFTNVTLIKDDFRNFIKENNSYYDLIHVDIIHTYEETYECGLWSAQHSNCTLFHDTESYSSVKKAVYDIARKTGKRFYNYPYCNGLGIVM